ncbi:MAG: type II toxin-antitoxin system HicA family toxin [Dehalococcoidia bacterium]
MTRLEKLIDRIKARPAEAEFADVEKLLEAFGYERKRQEGSHVSFKKAGARTIVVPLVSGRKVKRVYLDKLCELLGLDD